MFGIVWEKNDRYEKVYSVHIEILKPKSPIETQNNQLESYAHYMAFTVARK